MSDLKGGAGKVAGASSLVFPGGGAATTSPGGGAIPALGQPAIGVPVAQAGAPGVPVQPTGSSYSVEYTIEDFRPTPPTAGAAPQPYVPPGTAAAMPVAPPMSNAARMLNGYPPAPVPAGPYGAAPSFSYPGAAPPPYAPYYYPAQPQAWAPPPPAPQAPPPIVVRQRTLDPFFGLGPSFTVTTITQGQHYTPPAPTYYPVSQPPGGQPASPGLPGRPPPVRNSRP